MGEVKPAPRRQLPIWSWFLIGSAVFVSAHALTALAVNRPSDHYMYDTYYVVSNIEYLASLAVVFIVAAGWYALVRRSVTDPRRRFLALAHFWTWLIGLLAMTLPSLLVAPTPRTYIDDHPTFEVAYEVSTIGGWIALSSMGFWLAGAVASLLFYRRRAR